MKAVFVAATGQNVGKTTISLGLFSALQKKFSTVGFLKPVGQEYMEVSPGVQVDKDVCLFKDYFDLSTPYETMSPVILPRGFTKAFLKGKTTTDELLQKIKGSFHSISNDNAFTLVEGTGHVGVGSIVSLNNAKVAKELNLDMILIAEAGLGSSFDQLALNKTLADHYGVKIKGVILNRLKDDKREMIEELFPKALDRWGIPLLGCVPYNAFLNTPCMNDFVSLFNTPLLTGENYRYRHFTNTRLIAGSLESYLREMQSDELVITPACRHEIVEAVVLANSQNEAQNGLILTGNTPPSPETAALIQQAQLPIIYVPLCSYDAMKEITSYVSKTRKEDTVKISKAIQLVEDHLSPLIETL